jgi:DNA-binding NtrC family response regulator
MEIVVLDNDRALLRSVEIMLNAGGHRVHVFQDPESACRYVEKGGSLDILLLDYVMPHLSGTEVLQRIRKFLPGHARVVLISGHTEMIESLDLDDLGIARFLPKPLDLEQLDAVIADFYHQKIPGLSGTDG